MVHSTLCCHSVCHRPICTPRREPSTALPALHCAAGEVATAISDIPFSAASALARAVTTVHEATAAVATRSKEREEVETGRRAELAGREEGEPGGAEGNSEKVDE